MTICFKDRDDAIAFVSVCNEFDDAIDLVYGKNVIDAKSLMGVLSLDLSNEFKIVYKCYDDVDDFNDFVNTVKDKFDIDVDKE